MDSENFRNAFSMPVSDPAYGPPPYAYRNVEDMVVWFEAPARNVEAILPPRLRLPDGKARCAAWARWIPFSAFGPYHEAFIMVEVALDGVRYLYQPFIMVDNEIPLAAGREIWGYAKKLAVFTRNWGGANATYGEQFFFNVERPRGLPLMRASMVCSRKPDLTELGEDLPVLSCRIIPNAERAERPSVAELVRLDVKASIHESADGGRELYSGPAHVEFAGGAADRWRVFTPTRITNAFFMKLDFDLEFGRVVHDYLKDPELWG